MKDLFNFIKEKYQAIPLVKGLTSLKYRLGVDLRSEVEGEAIKNGYKTSVDARHGMLIIENYE